MIRIKKLHTLVCLLSVIALVGCYNQGSEVIATRRNIIDVGRVIVGDSISATFKFRNNTHVDQIVNFHSESDSTEASSESMIIGLHKVGRLDVTVTLKSPGEFSKTVRVEAANGDVFFNITVKGRGTP